MRWKLAAAAAVVLFTGIWLGAFAVAGLNTPSASRYAVDMGGARWIAAPGPVSARSYFRLTVSADPSPDSAILWLDAEQGYSVYVNGTLAGTDVSPARHATAPTLGAIDLTPHFAQGANVVAIAITNWNETDAAMRARLTLVSGTSSVDYVTGSAGWIATSNIPDVKSPTRLRHPKFSVVGFDASTWGPAILIPAVRGDIPSPVPADVLEHPFDAQVVGGPKLSGDITATTLVNLPGDPSDAWFRIIAPGRFVVLIDGSPLLVRGSPPPITAQLMDLGAFLHPGPNIISIHVMAPAPAVVYAEGAIDVPGYASVGVSTGREFAVADAPAVPPAQAGPATEHGTPMGRALAAFPSGFARNVLGTTHIDKAAGNPLITRGEALLGVLLLWIAFAWLSWSFSDLRRSTTLMLAAAAQIPGAAVIATLELSSRMAPKTSAFPHVPAMVWLVLAVLLGGEIAISTTVARAHAAAARELLEAAAGIDPDAPATPGRAASRGDRGKRRRSSQTPPWLIAALAPLRRLARLPQLAPVRRIAPQRRIAWLARLAARHPAQSAIVVLALILAAAAAYDIGYEPYWQDEIASLGAAQGMRSHLIPQLPSGFVYWKGELYSALIAVVGAITNDTPASLRLVTVFWYGATILAFGLFLVPTVVGPRRRLFQVAVTLLFATAPVNLVWSRDVRMYQQAQCMAILFTAFFLLALRTGRTRHIAAAALTLIIMYLSHEETFVFLPAIPVVFLVVKRLTWVRDRRWWFWGGGAFALIGVQYALATFTHPPFFGYDHSNKPYVVFDPHNFYYYVRQVYFAVRPQSESLMVLSSLSVLASCVGVARRSFERLYLTAFLWIPVLALSTIFTPKISRYVFITMPVVFLLGGLGGLDLLSILRRFFTTGRQQIDAALRRALIVTAAVGCVWVGLSMGTGPSGYGLAASRILGQQTTRKHADFDYTIQRVRSQIRPGDTIVTICPPNVAAYYLHRRPDIIVQTGRDKLLYLMDTNGKTVDTTFGAQVIFSISDFQTVLASHHRVWVITDQGTYLRSVDKRIASLVISQFQEMSEGTDTAVYFRNG